MKIALSGIYVSEPKSGLGVVTSNLIEGAIENDCSFDFKLYTHNSYWQDKYSQAIAPVSSSLAPDRGIKGHIKRLWWYQTSLNWQLKQNQLDLFYSPVHEGAIFPTVPQIVTVHDLIPLEYPEVNPKWHYYYRYVLPLILKNSIKVISISEHTKQDLVRHFKLDANKIEVIYNGLDNSLFSPQPNPEILKKYNLDKYLLYVGDMRFYKNLDRCLQAFDRLPNSELKFVITGKKDDFFYPRLQQKVDLLAAKDRIIFLNYVPTKDLPSLYSMAQCLVFASLYEGFGLPVLEAMACGCPVIASNFTSIPEVGGDSVLYVDAMNVEDIAKGMSAMLNDRDLRQSLIAKGLVRAKQFSWDKTVSKLLDLFANVG